MIAFSDSPVVAEQQMTAIIYYMTTFGFIDGRFDITEEMEIRRWIRALVEMRVELMGIPEVADRLPIIEKQVAYFERIFVRVTGEVQALFDETVAEGEQSVDFVLARLRLRCFELFRAFDSKSQWTLLFIVNRLLEADGIVHKNEAIFRDELVELLRDDLPSEPPPPPAVAASGPPPVTIEAPRRAVATLTEHPFLQLNEEHYKRDPERLREQLIRDHAIMAQAVEAWDAQRAVGRGRLQGLTRVDQIVGPPFLDDFVYALPDDGVDRELIVVGDLHGCYSCLKGALLQSDFFRKVVAHRENPAENPEPKLVFLGDYVDRGRFSYDGILRTVLQLFVSMPENVIVLRGNHEYYVDIGGRVSAGVAPAEAIATYAPYLPKQMFDSFRYLFERMPAMLIVGKMLYVHAGIPRDETLEARWRDLSSLNDSHIRFEMMWSDPTHANFIPVELQRQTARFPFGRQQFRSFMERIGCHTLVRGHEKIDEGFKKIYEDRGLLLLNLFSAGGRANVDLPENASYRSVTPMAMTVRHVGGQTIVTPWPIEWETWNQPALNGFLRSPPEIEFRVT